MLGKISYLLLPDWGSFISVMFFIEITKRNLVLRLLTISERIMILKNAGILDELLPELSKTFGVSQISPKRHHIYDVGTHLLKSLEATPSKNWLVRFATLIHDIGKPQVFRKDQQTNLITFYNHEMVGTTIAKNIAKRLNFSKKDAEKFALLVRHHQFTVDENQTDTTLRRFVKKVGKENLQDILDLRIGEITVIYKTV